MKFLFLEKVVAYKRLEGGIDFVDTIPKSPSGKILRRYLKDEAVKKHRTSKLWWILISLITLCSFSWWKVLCDYESSVL